MPGKETIDDVRIGDFTRPLAAADKASAPKAASTKATTDASPAAQKLDDAEARIATQIDQVEKDLTPLERYEKMLKSINVTRDEAAAIVDDILMKGYWEEEFALTPRRKIKLRSRTYRDTQRFYSFIEVEQPKNSTYFTDLLYKYSLAASLAVYGEKTFAFPDNDRDEIEKAFQVRLRFIEGLADPAVRMLYTKLGKFDEKIRIVTEEGSVESF